MPIKIKCPNPDCDFARVLADEMAGRKAKCLKCGQMFIVPTPGAAKQAVDGDLTDVLSQAVKQISQAQQDPRKKKSGPVKAVICPDCGEVYDAADGACPRCSGATGTTPLMVSHRKRRQRMLFIKLGVGLAVVFIVCMIIRANRRGAVYQVQRVVGQAEGYYKQGLALEASSDFDEALGAYQQAYERLLPVQEKAPGLMTNINNHVAACKRAEVTALLAKGQSCLDDRQFGLARKNAARARSRLNELGLEAPDLEQKIETVTRSAVDLERKAAAAKVREMKGRGLVLFDGEWITPEKRDAAVRRRFVDAKRAQGLALFDGDWLTPVQIEERKEEISRCDIPPSEAGLREWLVAWNRDINFTLALKRQRGDDVAAYYWLPDLKIRNRTRFPVRLRGSVFLFEQDKTGAWHRGVVEIGPLWRETLEYLPGTGAVGRVTYGCDVNASWRDSLFHLDPWVPMKTGPSSATAWDRLDVIIPDLEIQLGRRRLHMIVFIPGRYRNGAWQFDPVRMVPRSAAVLDTVLSSSGWDPLVRRLCCFALARIGGADARAALQRALKLAAVPDDVKSAARKALDALPAKP